ncbi:hypothetical protein PHYBLDRAFT_173993 [Phycomyces blakesleeanus NRRL 1555(-)]|uniref:Uncharacterized protein n=1 Tax=Phycomyces blakesleeanus (strain ATCC 8743b / DSM 1359 / FGSC 10004 / NBRC 33097 / NRRL 1555) TaxID=763407 RepID=A0A167KB84_PHYB8|nr:hypothetical protein PHYBLDRAFT_173993 [Phycomyces blakesleeanus NRRL 1555(-)]OAD67666.1 hypothetical protein PHYBLDRAFT_173993 [Phycomyces blakesleeanus NRRL 1555(-)]|eukprot:XP_018285706.1 hypothetical protein PHYBLDRAFT_173993 [Phycomyces blakesleeanus NRRL 1555(-)]
MQKSVKDDLLEPVNDAGYIPAPDKAICGRYIDRFFVSEFIPIMGFTGYGNFQILSMSCKRIITESEFRANAIIVSKNTASISKNTKLIWIGCDIACWKHCISVYAWLFCTYLTLVGEDSVKS